MSRTPGPCTFTWRKSSYSDGGQNNCVEVADGALSVVPVRDSKVSDGPAVSFSSPAWGCFVTALQHDALGA
jgi:hypothetical protein